MSVVLQKQQYFPPKGIGQQAIAISDYQQLGIDGYNGEHFLLLVDDHCVYANQPVYSSQQNYIKLHFRLAGSSTLVFDGFGEYVLDKPQLCISTCPRDRVKIDLPHAGERNTAVNLAIDRDFFTAVLGLDRASLPAPLNNLSAPLETVFALYSYSLTPTLAAAARSLINGQLSETMPETYYRAKAIELACLVIDHLQQLAVSGSTAKKLSSHHHNALYAVRDWVDQHYAEPITLTTLARQVGLSKTALTSGFNQVFGITVFAYIQQVRMAQAYQLLQRQRYSIGYIANAVGYNYTCNFSTAFKQYFGCSPKDLAFSEVKLVQ